MILFFFTGLVETKKGERFSQFKKRCEKENVTFFDDMTINEWKRMALINRKIREGKKVNW